MKYSKPHLDKDEFMTKLEIETNWMEYIKFMGSFLHRTIGPTALVTRSCQKGHRKRLDMRAESSTSRNTKIDTKQNSTRRLSQPTEREDSDYILKVH